MISVNELAERIVGRRNILREDKPHLFEVYNSLVGKSKFIKKTENPNTTCGSCHKRVRTGFWKYYHFEHENKSKKLEFYGREGGGRITGFDYSPVYIKI